MELEAAMDSPDSLPELMGELGEALVNALVEDPRCRELAHHIQALGFTLALSLEAGPHREGQETRLEWSDEDRKMMKSFRIALD